MTSTLPASAASGAACTTDIGTTPKPVAKTCQATRPAAMPSGQGLAGVGLVRHPPREQFDHPGQAARRDLEDPRSHRTGST